jgi:hypothetical protein
MSGEKNQTIICKSLSYQQINFKKAFTILKNIYKNEMLDVRLECKFRMSKLSSEKIKIL